MNAQTLATRDNSSSNTTTGENVTAAIASQTIDALLSAETLGTYA